MSLNGNYLLYLIIICGSCIVHLYFRLDRKNAKTEADYAECKQELREHQRELHEVYKRLESCESHRNRLNIRVAVLETGCGIVDCPLRNNSGGGI